MRQAETCAHQDSDFNIMLCLAHQVNERRRAILYHAHQSSVYNGGKMRQAETRAHQNNEFNIVLCLAHEVNERKRAIN